MFLGFKHFCSDLGIKEGVCRGEFQSQSLCQSQTNFKSMMFLFLFKIKKKKDFNLHPTSLYGSAASPLGD